MTEVELKRKLAAIEALLKGATTDGERAAAQHVFSVLKDKQVEEVPEELQFTVQDTWGRQLFIAILRKAGHEPYRRRGQRYTTIMVRGKRSFVMNVLWEQFLEANETLRDYLSELTNRVIRETLGETESEAKERPSLGA